MLALSAYIRVFAFAFQAVWGRRVESKIGASDVQGIAARLNARLECR
jgi:hypothetical protein